MHRNRFNTDQYGNEDVLKKNLTPEQEKERKQREKEMNAIYPTAEMKDEIRGLGQSLGVERYDMLLRLLIDVFNRYGPQYITEQKNKTE